MTPKTLLVIGFVWPEPDSSAAGSRMLQLIDQFQYQGYTVKFATTAKHTQRAFDLLSIGVSTESIELNNSSFDVFLKDLNPDIVLFDRFMVEEQFGWRVAEKCPNAIRILDTEDFHGLRKARELALKAGEKLSVSYLHNDTTKREIASIYRCDLSLIISEAEYDLLIGTFKIDQSLLCYLPFLFEKQDKDIKLKLPNYSSREHFITIGNFLHPPNYDAVLYLKQTIWPRIRQQLPDVELHIYGAYTSQKVTQLHNESEGFLIKGFINDANSVMQKTKICLAPLRFGAGLKGKLFCAMQNGTPCMMSTIASEGVFGDFPANGFSEDDAKTFSDKAVELYTSEILWQEKQDCGFKVLEQRFLKTNFQSKFKKTIQNLSVSIDTHRQQNFIGQLLQHHTMKSTTYMSKWIEAKSK